MTLELDELSTGLVRRAAGGELPFFGGEKLTTSEGKGPQLLGNCLPGEFCSHLVGFSMSFFTFPVGTAGRSFYT